MRTERLLIRPLGMADYQDLCEYGSDEETGRYMMYWPREQKEIQEYVASCVNAWKARSRRWYEFAMVLKESGRMIGNITLAVNGQEGEIGWISNRAYWGQGYMTEAVQCLLQYAFQNLPLLEITATCAEDNHRSYRVMEKCGMKKMNRIKRERINKKGQILVYNKLVYKLRTEESQRIYYDGEQPEKAAAICYRRHSGKNAILCRAGIASAKETLTVLPREAAAAALRLGIRLLGENDKPAVDFYPVPGLYIFGADAQQGLYAVPLTAGREAAEQPICYIRADQEIFRVADNAGSFRSYVTAGRQPLLSEYREYPVTLCPDRAAAEKLFSFYHKKQLFQRGWPG